VELPSYEAAGRPADAIAAYETLVNTPDGTARINHTWVWLGRTMERLSALHEAAGDTRNAAVYATQLTELWKNADPELRAWVDAANQRLRRLTREGVR